MTKLKFANFTIKNNIIIFIAFDRNDKHFEIQNPFDRNDKLLEKKK